MGATGKRWAIVLAGGEGSRRRGLTTTPGGVTIPKQFCSLRGGNSLLQDALQRATAVASPANICAVVSLQHQRWWERALVEMQRENVIVQPRNCGTANGILWPLLHIILRDPEASVVVLPSDHYVRDGSVLASALQRAADEVTLRHDEVLLLGMVPDEADPELGYIVPGSVDGDLLRVERFVEKPALSLARILVAEGAVWNAFILAGRARAFVNLYSRRLHASVLAMTSIIQQSHERLGQSSAAIELYGDLPQIDFSRDILEGAEASLRLLQVPSCGWSDLGTPKRLMDTLQALPQRTPEDSLRRACSPTSYLNLAVNVH